jgi:hypothetical protein
VYFYKPLAPVTPNVEAIKPRDQITVPSVKFTDVTREAGISFRFFNGAAGDHLLPETMTGGVAIFDFDGDGKQDILFLNARPWPGKENGSMPTMALYRNLGNFKFVDVTKEVGLDIPLFAMGVCIGDIDNDGWPDIFISAIGGNKLFKNIGGKKFVDITKEAGVGGPDQFPQCSYVEFLKRKEPLAFPSSVTFLDYDLDGKLDLLVCHYITWSPELDLSIHSKLAGLHRTYDQPIWFEGAQPTLYRNIDGTHFEDVSEKVNLRAFTQQGLVGRTVPATEQRAAGAEPATPTFKSAGKILGVSVADINHDGWPDIICACDTTRNLCFLNVADEKGARRFQEVSESLDLAYAQSQGGLAARGGMGIDWAEYYPDKYAFAIANFAKEPLSFFTHIKSQPLRFSDRCLTEGLFGASRQPLKFGLFFLDYDLDGRLDLLSCNGHIEPDINKVEDWQTYAQPAQLFWNTGTSPGAFELVREDATQNDLFKPIVGRGSAFGDLDGDGDLDVVLVNIQGEPLVLRNDQRTGNHWIRLVLEGDGKRVNRSAIGAEIIVEVNGQTLHRQVTSGRGYLSQSELPVTIGLGAAKTIDKITIHWPGIQIPPQVITSPKVDRTHHIRLSP